MHGLHTTVCNITFCDTKPLLNPTFFDIQQGNVIKNKGSHKFHIKLTACIYALAGTEVGARAGAGAGTGTWTMTGAGIGNVAVTDWDWGWGWDQNWKRGWDWDRNCYWG